MSGSKRDFERAEDDEWGGVDDQPRTDYGSAQMIVVDENEPIPYRLTDKAGEIEAETCVRTGCPNRPDPECPIGYCGKHCSDEAIQHGHRHSPRLNS